MLASVLHSKAAIETSIKIMRAFVQMKKFMISHTLMFERITALEAKQSFNQARNDEKFEKIFKYISDHEEETQKIFYEG